MEKQIKRAIASALSVLLVFTGNMTQECSVEAAKKPAISKKELKLQVGASKKLKIKNLKKKQKVTWKTNKKYVAIVNKKGKVTAKGEGTAVITAKVGKKKFTCKVTVKKKKENVEATLAPSATPPVVATDSPTPSSENISDTEVIQRIIQEQKALGATVSDDLNSEEYVWNSDGKLTEIHWYKKKLSGFISFEKLTELQYLSCGYNQLTKIDVSKNEKLVTLYCYNNQLTELDVSRVASLKNLSCSNNDLSSLDVSKAVELEKLS